MKVNSSAISDIDYDPDSQHLTIRFKSGQTHRHEGVPAHIHEQFINAPSIGKAYHALIRDQYPSTKL